jgi:hypothetical protein
MKLFLHIGTEKTGSSHLQSLSAINRNVLQQNRIWFPSEGKNDTQLMKGEISAGNAQSLTDALIANDFIACKSFIARGVEEAREKGCNTLFLSNELLILALAKDDRLNQFATMLDEMDISNIKFLLFLRDPVDQALSLYKHRAKNGNVLDIEEWPKKHYVYGEAIYSFLTKLKKEKIELIARKFSKQKGFLEAILFKQCLGVVADLVPPPKVVNPSLSLSELILIKKVRQEQPYLVNLLYNKLIGISKKCKCENSSIEQYHKESLSSQLTQYKDTWEICNEFLPLNEKIVFPKESANRISVHEKNSSFSDMQMEAIAQIIADSATLKVWVQINKLKIKTQLVKILFTLKGKS